MSRSPRATRRTPDSWNCGSSANWTSRWRPSTSLQKPWRGERLPAPGPPEQPSAVAWLAPPPVVQTTPLSNRGPLSVRGRPCLRRRTGAVLALRGPQTGDDPRGRLVLRESDPGHHFRRLRPGRWDLLDPRGIDHGFGGGDRGARGHGGGAVPATAFVPLLITIFWTAGVSAKAQMYRFMVRALQPPETRRWTDIASALVPALGIIAIAIVGYNTVRLVDLVSNPGSITSQEATAVAGLMVGGAFLPPGFALAGYLIFILIYGKTRVRLTQGLTALHASMFASVPAPPGAWSAVAPVAPPVATPPAFAAPMTPTVSRASPAPSEAPPAALNFCGQCGHPLPAGAFFCLNCGARTGASPPGPA